MTFANVIVVVVLSASLDLTVDGNDHFRMKRSRKDAAGVEKDEKIAVRLNHATLIESCYSH